MSQPIADIEQTIQVGIERLRGKTRMPTTVAELEDVPYGAHAELLDDIAKGAVKVRKHKVSMVYMANLFMTQFEKFCLLSILMWSWMLPLAGIALAVFKRWEFVFLAALVVPGLLAARKYYMNRILSVIRQSELAFVFFYRLGAISLRLPDGSVVHYENPT
jgi:hypothetical protein